MASHSYTKFEDHGQNPVEYPDTIPLEERTYNGRTVNLDHIIPAVSFQPQAFSPNLLDPVSKQLYDSLNTKHMSSNALFSSLGQGGSQLNGTVSSQFTSLKGCMSYNDMLQGLMYKGERLVQNHHFQFLQYNHILVCDEANSMVSQKPGGICLLTDKRILLLSSQVNQSTSLKMFGNPKKMQGGYSIETSLGDTTSYLPIPFRFLKSVEMNGKSGVQGSTIINPQPPCCGGLCGACGVLCGIPSMLKQWSVSTVNITEDNEMVISIGVLMPPWGRRMFIHIHVNINVPMPVVRDFVSLLQQFACELN